MIVYVPFLSCRPFWPAELLWVSQKWASLNHCHQNSAVLNLHPCPYSVKTISHHTSQQIINCWNLCFCWYAMKCLTYLWFILLWLDLVLSSVLLLLLLPHVPAAILTPPPTVSIIVLPSTPGTIRVVTSIVITIVVHVSLVVSRISPSPLGISLSFPRIIIPPLPIRILIIQVPAVIIPIFQATVWPLTSPGSIGIGIEPPTLVSWGIGLLPLLVLSPWVVFTVLKLSTTFLFLGWLWPRVFCSPIFTTSMSDVDHCRWLKSVSSFWRSPESAHWYLAYLE